MKKYLVRQSIDVELCYFVEAHSVEEAQEVIDLGGYDRSRIIDIQVLNWEKPWDIEEADYPVTPLSKDELNKYDILGI